MSATVRLMKDSQPKRPWRQYTIRSLLLLLFLVAVLMSLVTAQVKKVDARRIATEKLEMDLHSWGGPSDFPWYSSWLHKLFRQEDPYDHTFLVFNNFASVSDDTLIYVVQFESLHQLLLGGEILITDAGLQRLEKLKQLEELELGDAPVTAPAVERLRQSLPQCKISWQGQESP